MKTTMYVMIALMLPSFLVQASDKANPNDKAEADYPVPALESLNLPKVDSPLPGYTLRWADEFNEKEVNTDWWWYRVGENKKKLRAERASQVDIVHKDNNGFLRIRCKKVKEGGTVYLGGGLITKFQLRYGYYETRVKMGAHGWHEAFWTSIYNFQSGEDSYPFSRDHERMEVDCFEHGSLHDKEFSHGFHQWRRKHSGKKGGIYNYKKSLSDDFHAIGFEYTPKNLVIYFDGKKIGTYDISKATRNWFFLIISTIKLGGGGAQDCEVLWDYVRFFEKT